MNRSDFENWLEIEFPDEDLIAAFRFNHINFFKKIGFGKNIRKDKVTYQEMKDYMEKNKELILLKLL